MLIDIGQEQMLPWTVTSLLPEPGRTLPKGCMAIANFRIASEALRGWSVDWLV